jgi:DNA-binding MarR family transcriptional regulator
VTIRAALPRAALPRAADRRIVARTFHACTCVGAVSNLRGADDVDTMTDRNARATRARAKPRRPSGRTPLAVVCDDAVVARYASRGRECAFANTRVLARVVTGFYDDALEPAGVRASQLALLWAIVACEPVEMGRLGEVTATDQTTLSRTVAKLRRAGLVAMDTAEDRRVRLLRLTPRGRRTFARAMPCWEAAQQAIDRWLPLATLNALARQARHLPRDAG